MLYQNHVLNDVNVFPKEGAKLSLIADVNVLQYQNRMKTSERREVGCEIVDVLLPE
jgi:hypothetical protein